MSNSEESSGGDNDSEMDYEADGYVVANHLLDIRSGNHTKWEKSNNDGSDNDEQGKGGLLNGIMNSSTSSASNNHSLSTSKFFEPKFLELYSSFKTVVEARGNTIDLNDHLMNLCLDHLIALCSWCRSNVAKTTWIRTTLEDNPDLRPEVRNGLAMIVIYVLSAAKAVFLESEMFQVLQDASYGLGIVNKTSLKIYNDPFNYFNFIKSCISGLIDAGCIPENERLNQPKKSKRHMENKEEVSAFLQLKNIIGHMINRNDSQGARIRIQNILAVWQQRNKVIRNRRFATALTVLTSPQPPSMMPVITTAGLTYPNTSHPTSIGSLSSSHHLPISAAILSSATDPTSMRLLQSSAASALQLDDSSLSYDMIRPYGVRSPSSNIPDALNYLASRPTRPRSSSNSSTAATSSSVATSTDNPSSTSIVTSYLDPVLTTITSTTATDNHHHHHNEHHPIIADNAISSSSDSQSHRPRKQPRLQVDLQHISPNQSPSVPRAIPVMRFERVGHHDWELLESAVFDIDVFLQTASMHATVICLVDETKLTTDERANHACSSSLQGFVPLYAELRHRNALLTTWHVADYPQLKHMIRMYAKQNQEASSPTSLNMIWNQVTGYKTTSSPSSSSSSSGRGGGMLVYEVLEQIGMVVRIEGIEASHGECWRLFYLRDLLHQECNAITFQSFLYSLFPQLEVIMMMTGSNDSTSSTSSKSNHCHGAGAGTWIAKYCPHSGKQQSWSHPPARGHVDRYQTLGAINTSAASFLGRLDPTVSFHDFVLSRC